ncbi:unnamed protein product [Ophioblennius macclurei]
MALSLLCRRTWSFRGTFNAISSYKTSLSTTFLTQSASYNPRPLKLSLREPYIPDKSSDKTPAWQKTPKYDAKLFGRFGSASGVDPASLWPSRDLLDRVIAEEKELQPPLHETLRLVEAREKARSDKMHAREKLIAANMAKMPKMVADWRREKRDAKRKLKEEKTRRTKLLAEARERFGHAVDPRSPKFLEMVAEIEKEEKKKRKLMKRQQRAEQAAAPAPSAPPS